MTRWCWLWTILLGLGPAAAALPGRAEASARGETPSQRLRKSHDLDAVQPPEGIDPEALLLRLLTRRNQNAAELLKKYHITPEMFDWGLEFLKRSNNLPVPESMRKMLGPINPAELAKQFPREQSQDIRKRLEALQANTPPSSPSPPGAGEEKRMPPDRPAPPPGPMPGPHPGSGTASPPAGPGGPEQGRDEDQADSAFEQQMVDWAQRLQNLDPSLRDSPAFQKALRALSQHAGEEDPRWDKLGRGLNAMQKNWSAVKEAFHLDRLWPEKGLAWPKHLPRVLPPLRATAPSRTLGERIADSLPAADASKPPDLFSWQTGIGLTGLVLLAGLLWRLLTRLEQAGTRAAGGWQLGPWPVNPAAVASREELVRAFEYLSLLCLGPGARTWNHRVIAEHLAEERQLLPQTAYFDDRRRAVEELADLYERARYAPPEDALPEPALAAARRDLCLLAGVPTA